MQKNASLFHDTMITHYRIESGEAPWGGYGAVLWNGWVREVNDHGPRTLMICRTGPFVPPITEPFGESEVIVTDEFRMKLSDAGFSGLAFEPVHYEKVVRIEWDKWDQNAEDPLFYPEDGEPEYYLDGAHDAQLASTMPKLWAWSVAATPGLQVKGTGTFHKRLHPGTDVARGGGLLWVNERLKVWLDENAGQWVRCCPVIPHPLSEWRGEWL